MDKPHKKLDVWKVSMELVTETYRLTSRFPSEERFGLISQLRRAAVSIPGNIAEGAARNGVKEYRNFISIARGSLSELDTQFNISLNLGFVDSKACSQIDGLLVRIDKMLYGLLKQLSRS